MVLMPTSRQQLLIVFGVKLLCLCQTERWKAGVTGSENAAQSPEAVQYQTFFLDFGFWSFFDQKKLQKKLQNLTLCFSKINLFEKTPEKTPEFFRTKTPETPEKTPE